MSLYVEAFIRTELDELWRRTQDPDLHQRWDLREPSSPISPPAILGTLERP